MNPIIDPLNMLNSNWADTFSGIDVPNELHDPLQTHFVRRGANTPLQFIGNLLAASFIENGARMNREGFLRFLRKYRGDELQEDNNIQRPVRRTLYALAHAMFSRLGLNTIDEQIEDVMEDFDAFEYYLNEDKRNAGGNKKKRSAKRKSSKKRSTRSKK